MSLPYHLISWDWNDPQCSMVSGWNGVSPWWQWQPTRPEQDKEHVLSCGAPISTMDAFVVAADVLYHLGFLICLCWWFPAGFWGFGSSGFTDSGHRVDLRTYLGSGQKTPFSRYCNLSVKCHPIQWRWEWQWLLARFWGFGVIRIGCLWPQQGRSDLRTFGRIRTFLCPG